ncbi:hypothetical protein [Thalassoroseus pseudoceratinae]|uniref:hypothetical protein n=1 Tax=Thalassoroseus pseudoceratinae TaxID=2713176 RepID=UPI00141F1D37|nr:hypothetical protein [Thalassoroseus pseudoceratinae]
MSFLKVRNALRVVEVPGYHDDPVWLSNSIQKIEVFLDLANWERESIVPNVSDLVGNVEVPSPILKLAP